MTMLASSPACAPTGLHEESETCSLRVIGEGFADCSVRTENGDVNFHLHKVRSLNLLQGIEWHVSDGHDKGVAVIIVRHKPFKRVVTFEKFDGTLLAELSHERFTTESEFTYNSTTYRWEAQLRSTLTLTDLNTGKEVALFQADGSLRVLPWKAEDKIKISRSCHDSTWMRLVIASGIIEADRIGGRRWF